MKSNIKNLMLAELVLSSVKIAAANSDTTDQGYFPFAAFEELKKQKLLGAMVPAQFGGLGASLTDIASMCFELGSACGSTGLIFAMHQIEVAMLIPACNKWHENFLHSIATEQCLLASVTSEEGVGGSVRTSIAHIEGYHVCSLTKKSTAISYGEYADALLVTARCNREAAASEQVLVTITKQQYSLDRTTIWDTIGMRGTCSHGFVVQSSFPNDQISEKPFGEIAEQIMLPVSHLLWSSVWLGIASDALTKARAFLRDQMRKNTSGQPLPGANRLADGLGKLKSAHARIRNLLELYEEELENTRFNNTPFPISFTTEMNSLKVFVSETALEIVNQALMICGIQGYKNGTPYSLGRHLRDIHSSRLMINNDRIVSNMSGFLVAQRSPLLVF